MKLKFIVLTLAVTAFIACKQKPKEETNTADSNATQAAPEEQTATTPENSEKGVFFVNLKDGETLKSPVIVQMGINGMEVEPAGEKHDGKGHHHIIIDGTGVETGRPVGKDATHIHYGAGQTSDTLELTPGKHTLTLQFADGLHQSYGPEWGKTITVEITK